MSLLLVSFTDKRVQYFCASACTGLSVQDLGIRKPLLGAYLSEYDALLTHAERSSTEPQRMVWRRALTVDGDSDMDEAELELSDEAQQDERDDANSTKIAAHLNLSTQQQQHQQQLMQWANEDSAATEMTATGKPWQARRVLSLECPHYVNWIAVAHHSLSSLLICIQELATALSLLQSPPLWRPKHNLPTAANIDMLDSTLN